MDNTTTRALIDQNTTFDVSNCTLVAVVGERVLKHPLAKLQDDGLTMIVVGAVYLVPNSETGLQDPTKIPLDKIGKCHCLADVDAVFKTVGVRRIGTGM